jgi:bacteriocin-like protein
MDGEDHEQELDAQFQTRVEVRELREELSEEELEKVSGGFIGETETSPAENWLSSAETGWLFKGDLIRAMSPSGLCCVITRLMHRSKSTSLFDHLVGAGE